MQSRWRKICLAVLPVAAALTLASGPIASAAYAQSLTRAARSQKARSALILSAKRPGVAKATNHPSKPKTPQREVSASAVVLLAPKTAKPATIMTTHFAWGQVADGGDWTRKPQFAGFVPRLETPERVVPHRPAYDAHAPPVFSQIDG